MKYINRINNSSRQRIFLTGNANQRITMDLRFLPSQESWMADFYYNDFTLKGIHVVASPNILRAYKNIIPFGIICTTEHGLDPYRIDDFRMGTAKLFLQDQEERDFLENYVYGD